MVIPPDFKIIVRVYQFRWCLETPCALSQQADDTTRRIKKFLTQFGDKQEIPSLLIDTSSELRVLRLLRHVREEVDGIRLSPQNLQFWFDKPEDSSMLKLDVTEDGDFAGLVPGGFFTQRVTELF